MDRLELEQRILDKTIDPLEKYKDLWEYYYPRLLIYIKSFKKISGSEHTDIVSDILLKTFNNLHKYNQLYSLSTWIYNIAKNYALDLYRKTNPSILAFSDDAVDEQAVNAGEQDSMVDAIIQNDLIEKCRECIKSLHEKDKRLVFLRYYEGLNSKEISLIEGVSRSAVRRRLMVVKSHIKKLLGDDYGH
ncbi:MAG: sigma-70 family RNA polymerase sigma factor [Treponema sp.]|jgi:RNA polymerase sigma-70 factor (ECF subfamily)|nr:sigma-70 family RNA polymerase sigma factor [Treponema sp.]